MEKNCIKCSKFKRNGGSCPFVSSNQVGNDLEYGTFCSLWQPIEENKMKEYELTEKYKDGFSLVDIMKENPYRSEFFKLINEAYAKGAVRMTDVYGLDVWLDNKTIQNNLPWLESRGFIQEKEEKLICLHCGIDDCKIRFVNAKFFITCKACEAETGLFSTKQQAIKNWKGIK